MPYTSGMSGGGLVAGSVLIPGGGVLAEAARAMLLVAGGVFGAYALAMLGLIAWGRLTSQTTGQREATRWTSRAR